MSGLRAVPGRLRTTDARLGPLVVGALRQRTFASVRRHRNFRLWFLGQLVSLAGTWMQDAALPWLVLERTHSSIQVGLLLFCRYVPFMVFGLEAGLLADRVDNRRFLMATQAAAMVIAGAMAIVAFLDGPMPVIYVLAVLGGTAVVFDLPNRQALTFRLVGRDEIHNAVALNSSLQNAGRIVGPAVAGLVIAAAGVGFCFAVNAVSFLATLAALVLMRPEELFPIDRGSERASGARAIRDGIVYAWRRTDVQIVLTAAAVIGTLGFNFRVLIPVLTAKTLDSGPRALGGLFASFGVGALAGALLAASAERPRRRGLLVGLGGLGLVMMALAFVPTIWTAAVLLALAGLCFTLWSATAQTILGVTAPDGLRGRLISLYLFLVGGLAPIGSLLSGWLADIGGTKLAFFVSGVAGTVTATYATVRIVRLKSSFSGDAAPVEYLEPPV